jgi:hypothetical protein
MGGTVTAEDLKYLQLNPCSKCNNYGHSEFYCPMGTTSLGALLKASNPGLETYDNGKVRKFASGANRSDDSGKPDFEGFISPLVVERYGEYMHKHRKLPDGSLRASDNWQAGIPQRELLKSAYRHFMDWWMSERGHKNLRETVEDSLCALIFNASAYLHKLLVDRKYRDAD